MVLRKDNIRSTKIGVSLRLELGVGYRRYNACLGINNFLRVYGNINKTEHVQLSTPL